MIKKEDKGAWRLWRKTILFMSTLVDSDCVRRPMMHRRNALGTKSDHFSAQGRELEEDQALRLVRNCRLSFMSRPGRGSSNPIQSPLPHHHWKRDRALWRGPSCRVRLLLGQLVPHFHLFGMQTATSESKVKIEGKQHSRHTPLLPWPLFINNGPPVLSRHWAPSNHAQPVGTDSYPMLMLDNKEHHITFVLLVTFQAERQLLLWIPPFISLFWEASPLGVSHSFFIP